MQYFWLKTTVKRIKYYKVELHKDYYHHFQRHGTVENFHNLSPFVSHTILGSKRDLNL